MPKGKIAFVVGHANWGKSKTLSALTNGNYRLRRTTIAEDEFFIRRMSNDDQPKGYIKFMLSLDPALRPYLIAALCPPSCRNRLHSYEPMCQRLPALLLGHRASVRN